MAAPTVTLDPGQSTTIDGREVAWDEVTATFDASSDPWSLTINATNFPMLAGTGRYASGSKRYAWMYVLRTENTSATGTFTVTVDDAAKRLATLDATSAASGHCQTGELEPRPLAIRVAIGDVLTIDKGEAGGAGAGTVTIGIGPSGVA